MKLINEDRNEVAQPAPQPELCEADRMTILLKKKAQQLKGVDGNVLDAEYTTKKTQSGRAAKSIPGWRSSRKRISHFVNSR
jgi:hypothetical protein